VAPVQNRDRGNAALKPLGGVRSLDKVKQFLLNALGRARRA
jgi:hypothetical protein